MSTGLPLPSNRSFGRVFIAFFFIVGSIVWWKGGRSYPWWFGASALTLLVTLAIPSILTPFNRAWMKLAEVLNRIMSPVILGIIFFGVFTPMALVMRLAGRDVLYRKFDKTCASYWTKREPPGPDPDGLPNQF